MASNSEDNKRIAKNTLFLYFRMLLTMFVSLFTSRVILNTLGVVDYGLNNVIAGVITLFTFLNGALSGATSRFLTFELGKGNKEQVKKTFCTAFNIHFCMAIIVVLFCETAGLWIVNNVLEIPADRLFACNVIYQFVIISAFLSITQVPLNAMIISHERMNIYAYLGVSDAIFKLCVAYLITISTFDKLITLGSLNMIISIGIYIFYHIYCKRSFSEYNIGISREKKLYKEMLGFSTWSLIGQLQMMLKNQGITILINVFFGPAVNAANAIAYQVNNAIYNFSNNFTTALVPSIIKSYATGEREQMKSLIFRGAKFSFFLLTILSIPALLETELILHLWLIKVPEYTVILTRLIITFTLIESYSFTVWAPINATGKIRDYQIFLSCIYLLILPLSFLSYKLGAEPSAALIISNILCIAVIPIRLFFLKKAIGIGIIEYIRKVFLINITVFIASLVLPLIIHLYLPFGITRFLIIGTTSVISSTISIYSFGLTSMERKFFLTLLKTKLHLNI
ncbi:hypothetical protein D0T84_14555 [Dysgonomonas sp. 521]|uniref:hypothetical protein n=1 Tax=Dysgonomonas sp. 521 TaxID=2302932 RepID=UPI0013D14250|nr:hypothetical protein [Dysgonomonas sp. 521]NDV96124.1 hypothetical protein [Dysgonomonas sp. 521]